MVVIADFIGKESTKQFNKEQTLEKTTGVENWPTLVFLKLIERLCGGGDLACEAGSVWTGLFFHFEREWQIANRR
jgi:hypothetical protein